MGDFCGYRIVGGSDMEDMVDKLVMTRNMEDMVDMMVMRMCTL